MKILMVEWVKDLELNKDWVPINEAMIPETIQSTYSLGFEAKRTDEYLVLAPNINSFGMDDCTASGLITIQISSIKEILEMKVEDKSVNNDGPETENK